MREEATAEGMLVQTSGKRPTDMDVSEYQHGLEDLIPNIPSRPQARSTFLVRP